MTEIIYAVIFLFGDRAKPASEAGRALFPHSKNLSIPIILIPINIFHNFKPLISNNFQLLDQN